MYTIISGSHGQLFVSSHVVKYNFVSYPTCELCSGSTGAGNLTTSNTALSKSYCAARWTGAGSRKIPVLYGSLDRCVYMQVQRCGIFISQHT